MSYAAETVCNDNGGAGWPFPISSTTDIIIPYQFGDNSAAYDVNVFVDITKHYIGDLTARVTSPTGTPVLLFERPGTTLGENIASAPWGCNQDDIAVTFDDEAAIGTNIENVCGGGVPSIQGNYLSHNTAPNNLSALDGESPNGTWNFQLVHVAPYDPGTLNQVCITASFAAVTFDKWVSTNNTCSDTLDALTVPPGTGVYYCYTVSNPSTETFTINPGNATDDQGHDLSSLETTYVQNASQTVVIGPIIAGSAALPDNTTTINNAQVTATFATANYTGNLVTSESASLTVNIIPPNLPASGVKQLYFDNVNGAGSHELTRVPPAGITTSNIITRGATLTLNQAAVFEAPFTITGGSTAIVNLRVLATGGSRRDVQVELFNGGTGSSLGIGTANWSNNNWITLSIPVNIAAGGADFSVNDFVRIVITNTGGNNRNFQIATSNAGIRSELQMQSSTVVNIDNISVHSAAYPAITQFSSYKPGSTVYIRATVSDPFGNADITSAKVTITDSSPTVRVNNLVMTSVATPTGATRVYEYQYIIPATPDGSWEVSVTANEGTEGTVSHTAQTTMTVGIPNITISKNSAVLSDPINASNPKAIPGAIIEYTIGVENSGFGYVDVDSTVLNDPIASGTTFYFGSPLNPATFIDGATASGLSFTFIDLASAVDDIDFSNDAGLTFITPTTDANGFDTTSPPINYIRINPKGGFKGSDSVNNPSMQINFRVRVD